VRVRRVRLARQVLLRQAVAAAEVLE